MQWANEVDGVILEDDYDSEFRYDRQPPGTLQGLAPDRVVALGSVSKTLAPALRIGWVFTPPKFRDAIVDEMYFGSRGVPQIDQVALARLIGTGRFDRHLRRMRNAYRQRRDALVLAVADYMPGVTIAGLEAGHHALLRLPAGVAEERVVADARPAGIAVQGLGAYRVTPDDGPGNAAGPAALVIGFGNATTTQIITGIQMLAEILTSATR
jgi:GntR family transcriptional regulator/MocR family aminotransferase